MNKILLIDDNLEIQDINHEYLTSKGYQVDVAMDGGTAVALLKTKQYDCIVLDVMLPDLDGYAVCAVARSHGGEQTPIIFLSCLGGEDSRIKGLIAGGDDYMTKPYSLKELAARIHAHVRRSKVYDSTDSGVKSPAPSVMVQRENRIVAIGGVHLIMSRAEYEILTRLLENPRKLVSKGELLGLVADEESTLFTCVRRIRLKLATDETLGVIETVFGEGYQYLPPKGGRVAP